MSVRIIRGDCREVLKTLADDSVDSIVTDPPYHLTTGKKGGTGQASVSLATPAGRARIGTGFMGMKWDGGDVAQDPAMWAECLRVLKPGGHLLAFSGTRTQHRMVCAIEDAGFEIRDQAGWMYGSGFPKNLDVSKAIDKAAGATREVLSEGKAVKRMIPDADQNDTGSWIKDNGREFVPTVTAAATEAARQWEGWGTALKPAWEPICVARKPLAKGKTVAANVLEYGTGALNIDGCRVEPTGESLRGGGVGSASEGWDRPWKQDPVAAAAHKEKLDANADRASQLGRWPANLLHDGSPEVVALFPSEAGGQDKRQGLTPGSRPGGFGGVGSDKGGSTPNARLYADGGSAARFFWSPKTSSADRHEGLQHPGPQFTAGSTMRDAENLTPKGNHHPTVKPTELMRYLCRLVTPPGGLVLDPFMGSGSTLKAAELEGFNAIGIELDPAYIEIAKRRIAADMPLFAEVQT